MPASVTWSGRGELSDPPLGGDGAALDLGRGPTFGDRAVCTLAAIQRDHERLLDGAQQMCVGLGRFGGAPVPGDDMVDGGDDQSTLLVEVGAVDEGFGRGCGGDRYMGGVEPASTS